MAYKSRKKKVKKNVPEGIASIHSTFNNTITTITDVDGNVISWSSAGAIGYKGTKKKTPYAAGLAAAAALEKAKEFGLKEVSILVKGIGPGKSTARKQIETSGLVIKEVKDVTPTPHNGTRPPKKILNRE